MGCGQFLHSPPWCLEMERLVASLMLAERTNDPVLLLFTTNTPCFDGVETREILVISCLESLMLDLNMKGISRTFASKNYALLIIRLDHHVHVLRASMCRHGGLSRGHGVPG